MVTPTQTPVLSPARDRLLPRPEAFSRWPVPVARRPLRARQPLPGDPVRLVTTLWDADEDYDG